MLHDYTQIRESLKSGKPPVISVAVAQDREVLHTIKLARDEGLAGAILVGDRGQIERIMGEEGISSPAPIIHETDDEAACRIAVELVKSGDADLLMKGLVNSSIFLRAVLRGEKDSGSKGFLSHLAVFQILGHSRLIFTSDGGMNVAPGLEEKKQILINGVKALHSLGIELPKVAILAANEKVDPKIPATADAAALVKMWEEGEIPRCLLEGPVAMDVALSKDAAIHKGIDSRIAGEVDLFIVPNIEAGNMVGKTMIYFAGAKMAGLILGAQYPIVMTSRAENAEGKLNSIALAAAISRR
ncbi:MAG: phosphate butyryltransferase [Clostridiales bacterium]|nr:phosphate butyryltransferase [Clostridiales bacterium]